MVSVDPAESHKSWPGPIEVRICISLATHRLFANFSYQHLSPFGEPCISRNACIKVEIDAIFALEQQSAFKALIFYI